MFKEDDGGTCMFGALKEGACVAACTGTSVPEDVCVPDEDGTWRPTEAACGRDGVASTRDIFASIRDTVASAPAASCTLSNGIAVGIL